MSRFAWILAAAGLVAGPLAVTAPAFAADAPALPKGMSIGDTAPAFETTDLDGKPFSLATARTIKAEDALASVNAAAKAAGAKADVKAEDGLDTIEGFKGDAGLDAAKVAALGSAAGKPYGLVATPDSVKDWKTVGDAAKWITGSADAPIVFLCWSSKCPTSQMYEPRIVEALAATGARLYALGCCANDPEDAEREYVTERKFPFRVLADHDQKFTDVLGGRKTPHAFVFDAKNTLRYAGTIDNDAAEMESAEKRIPYLRTALESLKEGKGVDILMTAPVG